MGLLGNQVCDPASARFFEGRQIWEVLLKKPVSKVSCEGLRSLGGILFFIEILGNQTCDPESAGFFEGRQIWEVSVERICVEGFKRRFT